MTKREMNDELRAMLPAKPVRVKLDRLNPATLNDRCDPKGIPHNHEYAFSCPICPTLGNGMYGDNKMSPLSRATRDTWSHQDIHSAIKIGRVKRDWAIKPSQLTIAEKACLATMEEIRAMAPERIEHEIPQVKREKAVKASEKPAYRTIKKTFAEKKSEWCRFNGAIMTRIQCAGRIRLARKAGKPFNYAVNIGIKE